MWPTSNGNRTLDGAEAVLIAAALQTMLDSLEELLPEDEEDDLGEVTAELQSGIAVFDHLTVPQRIAMLHYVAKHLLTSSAVHSPNTNAVEDATIAAIFAEVRDQVMIEVDVTRGEIQHRGWEPSQISPDASLAPELDWQYATHWRQLTLEAFLQVCERDGDLEEFDLPEPWSTDFEDWDNLIDQLVSSILWDLDFELASGFMDEAPELAQRRRKLLGIDDEYFVEPPLDPKPGEARVLMAQAKAIANRIVQS